jgi:hypothetical protein
VQGGVERRLRAHDAIHVLEPLLDRLERERVVLHQRRGRDGQKLDDGVDRLAAVIDGRRLPAPDDPVVLELHLNHGLVRPGAARDAERLGELERAGGGAELHGADSMTAGLIRAGSRPRRGRCRPANYGPLKGGPTQSDPA